VRCHQCGTPAEESARFCSSCGAAIERDDPSSPGDPLIGRTIGGSYLLQELIGVGGMGRVYRGVQNALGRTVALKVIHPHLLGDEQTVARFYNEARAASRLNHPSSVGIIDFGRTEDGILYLVMEHLAGKDLATVIAEEGPLPFPRIVSIVRRVVSALGEAHALGVIHRDLKPENILILRTRRGDDQVKVVDFGLATITGPQSTSITTPGLVCGTPDYMSPEQGRGDPLDPRADLYSMGVMLFELLTDRLPYSDDTPTKVVLRHIHDPVPDPREIAPQRDIPIALSDIAKKLLSKDPKDRYQSADELDEALRRAVEPKAERAAAATVKCASCGATNPSTVKFCGDCGARLTGVISLTPTSGSHSRSLSPPVRTPTTPPASRSPLVGRQAEIDKFVELRSVAHDRAVWLRVVGEPGVGKSRLLSELAARGDAAADFVVQAVPHPSWAPVPYYPIRALLARLFDVDVGRLAELAQNQMLDPLVRAGIAEAVEPRGLVGVPGTSRAGAVGAALAQGVRLAARKSGSGLVLLVVDDLHRADGLSRNALSALMDHADLTSLLVVTSVAVQRDVGPLHGTMVNLVLRGLDDEETRHFLAGTAPERARPVSRDDTTNPGNRLFLPLYLEQVRALGATSAVDETLPPRLADAVMARVERLDLPARRLLQAASVLGERASLDALKEIAAGNDLAPLDTLMRLGLARLAEGDVVIAHPFIRELVEASIPAEARKDLHAHALTLSANESAPLEVRAEHAFRAGEPMSALLLLERMGEAALTRGDAHAAVLAFRRGLDLARRELMISGDDALDRAVVTFSRKLGESLDASGDSAGADGVLREALELVGPASKERARMSLQLGRVAVRRDRARDAVRLFGQAIESAGRTKDVRTEAEAHLELGRLRRKDDGAAALAALKRACELLQNESHADALLANALLTYADALLEAGQGGAAEDALLLAQARAKSANSSALSARVTGVRARVKRAAGDSNAADSLLQEAAELAAAAGDAESAARFIEQEVVVEAG
jgi:serine/threonine-protein kinase